MNKLTRETMRSIRENQLKISQEKLGNMLGYSRRQIANIESGHARVPLWMPLALAWIVLNGAHNPFIDVST